MTKLLVLLTVFISFSAKSEVVCKAELYLTSTVTDVFYGYGHTKRQACFSAKSLCGEAENQKNKDGRNIFSCLLEEEKHSTAGCFRYLIDKDGRFVKKFSLTRRHSSLHTAQKRACEDVEFICESYKKRSQYSEGAVCRKTISK